MANKHGGKRDGAGAKPIGESAMKVVTARLSKQQIEYLATINPNNLSDAIRQLIDFHR